MSTRSLPKEIKKIIAIVAEKTGLDCDTIEDIYIHEFEFISDQMVKGEKNNSSTYENILIKKLGTFLSNERHINKLKEINDAKEDKPVADCV